MSSVFPLWPVVTKGRMYVPRTWAVWEFDTLCYLEIQVCKEEPNVVADNVWKKLQLSVDGRIPLF